MAETSAPGAVRYRTLVTDSALVSIFLVSGVAALGVNGVPVALPGIGAAFDLTESEIGLVMTAFAFAGLVTIPVVSLLADVYGRRSVVIPSLLLIGTAGLATVGATDFRTLILLRALQGIGFAGTVPLSPTLIGDLYTRAEGSAAQGIRSGVNGLAAVIAPLVAGVLTAIAWQYPFVLFGCAFPVAVLVYRYYPEPVTPRGTDGRVLAGLGEYASDVLAAADRRVGLMTLGGFTLFFLKGGFMTFLPVYVVDGLGATTASAGTLLGVYGGVRVLGAPLSGSIMARLGRKATVVGATGLAAAGMGALPLVPTVWLLGVATASYSLGEAVLNPVISDAVAASATDEQRAGIMSGLQTLKQVALTVAPVVVGFLIGATGYTTAFLLAAALGVAYGAVIVVHLSAVEPTR